MRTGARCAVRWANCRVLQAFDGESALRDASVKSRQVMTYNYIRFAASVELRKRAVYTIQQRRGWCSLCNVDFAAAVGIAATSRVY